MKRHRRKSSRPNRSRVDVDAVLADIGFRHRRVFMNNGIAPILRRIEKQLANPHEIFGRLLFQCTARPQTRMHE